jgi:hypothetical protein
MYFYYWFKYCIMRHPSDVSFFMYKVYRLRCNFYNISVSNGSIIIERIYH